ncbi:structural maintenance of chromosomes protein 5-like [Papaver somniferum]|uniref:structural maintenance of chromosomes protein 5-like n=1 Tax=Papaver somniferum TaxID=3469 RepID=UPI000E6FE473|nr:structural maintenance of chromosomes protein 5-like [Papaver somniferum]
MAEEPAAKRFKRNHDDYLPGNITTIELHNFMTFNHVTCKPAPRLNIVVGPNGAGKSSLVCAIALGLGGKPKLLGRASKIGAYVKRGETSGFIKITLNGDRMGESITITRNIYTDNKSEWMINDKQVHKSEVLEIIQKFNIQVGNLTQFLPQDRVCEFAKLTPVQLLEETEKAVGDPQLPLLHTTLVDRSSDYKRLEVTIKHNRDALNKLNALNVAQEKDIERVLHGKNLLKKVESMKKKLPWLRYEQRKSDYMNAKEEETDAMRKKETAAEDLSDLQGPIEELRKNLAAQEELCENASNIMATNSEELIEKLQEAHLLEVQVQGKYDEMEELKTQDETRQERIETAEEQLAVAQQALENLPDYDYESPMAERDLLGTQIVELINSAKEKRFQESENEYCLGQKKRTLNECLDRLTDMEDDKYKLLQALKRSGADKIYEAYRWLKEHRHEFKKEVYGPILLDVTVPDKDHASYLENHVASYIWRSFVAQDADDRDILVDGLKQFDVPVLNYVGGRGNERAPLQLSEEMQKFGIYSRLDQVFDGPNAVKEVLISQFGLQYSYIGNMEADRQADRVHQLGISDLWTPGNHYRWKKSRYGGHVSASVDSVSPSRLFQCIVDADEVQKLKSSKRELEDTIAGLEENCKKLQSEQRQLEDETAKLRTQRKDIINTIWQEKRNRRRMENHVDQRRIMLESIVNEDDLETSLQKLGDETSELNTKRFHLVLGIKDMLTQALSYERSYAEKSMTSVELDGEIREMERSTKKQEQAVAKASKELNTCRWVTERSREELSDAKRHAERIAKITPELSQEFLTMPNTIDELEAAIEENIWQTNLILQLNRNVLEEYESRQKKIQEISKKLEADEEELKMRAADIHSLKEQWLPTLRNLVAKINETFSRNFQEMAVAGEVSLDEHGMDFDKYGILIKVKFRQTGRLQVLSAHHQSGGERSVSTILYLVSLQDLTNCPFRVVDEINQGMDPINERKMFQKLVRAASQLNTPQCFLLTPKLLPDLEYSDACSMLTVMNGPWIKGASKVWNAGDSWGTLMNHIFACDG